jgi:hypothetical protein
VPTAGSGSPDAIVALRASSVYHAMVSGRTRGAATGRYRVIVVIDPHCPVCAEEYGPLCAAVLPARGPAIPTLALETLIMLRPSDPSGADLARHLLATASLGSSRFDAVLAVVLGTPAGLDFTGMRSRIAEVDDPSQLEAALEHDRSAVEQLLSDDGERLRELNGGKARAITPQVLLLQRGPTGAETVIRSWQGRLDPSQVAADIRTLVAH